uniref:Uncharacterized protein n=1 Tax=Salvator merianae TaxID=96440 RepID=A0A8D0BLT4_SALMN
DGSWIRTGPYALGRPVPFQSYMPVLKFMPALELVQGGSKSSEDPGDPLLQYLSLSPSAALDARQVNQYVLTYSARCLDESVDMELFIRVIEVLRLECRKKCFKIPFSGVAEERSFVCEFPVISG